MGTYREPKWTEEKIQDKLSIYFLSNSTKKFEIFNKFIYDWESDYIAITNSGYVYECEIKISRADFFNDSKKIEKHLILESTETNKQRPNYLYYAVPDGLIKPEEVPNGYGLLYVRPWGVDVIKKAEPLHKEKADFEKLKLLEKLYWSYKDYRDKWRKADVSEMKKEIRKLEKTIVEYDDMLSEANAMIDELKMKIK